MEILYLVSITFITAGAIFVNSRGNESTFDIKFTPSLVLLLSFYLYSISLPLSRLMIGDANVVYPPDSESDNLYMFHHILAAFGLLLGIIVYRVIFARKRMSRINKIMGLYAVRPRLFFVLSSFMVLLNVYLFAKHLGGIENIFQPYGYNAAQDLFDASSLPVTSVLDAVGTYLAIVPLVMFFSVKNRMGVRIAAYWVVAFLAMLFLVRGHRNLLGMLLMPIFTLYMLDKALSPKQLLVGTFGLFFFLYTVAIMRNFNFREIGDAYETIQLSNFDPLAGEFGTSFSVYSKFKEIHSDDEYSYGKTYTSDVLSNLVPRFMWPSRPMSTAQTFSMTYFGSLGHGKGLGFSPVVEALVNFGVWGILPIFSLTAIIICWLEKWLSLRGAVGLSAYAFLSPMMFNWNRIDIAITVKMFLVFVLLAIIYSRFLFVKNTEFNRRGA